MQSEPVCGTNAYPQRGWHHVATGDYLEVSNLRTHMQRVLAEPARFGSSLAEAMQMGWVRYNLEGMVRRGRDWVFCDRFIHADTIRHARAAVRAMLRDGLLSGRGILLVGIGTDDKFPASPIRLGAGDIEPFARTGRRPLPDPDDARMPEAATGCSVAPGSPGRPLTP